MGNLVSLLYLAAYLFAGYAYSLVFIKKADVLTRVLLSASIALLALMWLPAILSFFMGFTLLAQWLALILCLLPAIAVFIWRFRGKGLSFEPLKRRDLFIFCALVLSLMVLCGYLLHTHILRPVDGALHTGQSCYGDMAMHLSFISSITRNTAFPPLYSIQAGYEMGYPFLCDSVSSTFLTLGASLRFAYILPMLLALFAVFGWIYLLFRRWLESPLKAALGFIIFFLGAGFGFAYFLNGAVEDSYTFTRIFHAFYETPTNNVAENMIWVNPICDMLVPQRATLFGWSLLFPCLYLLYEVGFGGEKKLSVFVLLGLFAGGLPLVHTHSFMALGLLSAFVLLYTLLTKQGNTKGFLLYALLAAALALPQLLKFTFSQVGDGSNFLTFNFNWVNDADPYLWFYIKNMGLPFLLLPFAIANTGKKRWFFLCAIPIWLIAEFIQFQPNAYDNNKLIFIPYLLLCGLTAELLFILYKKLEGLKLRGLLAGMTIFALVFSGTLTIGREVVSDYQLFSKEQVEAAKFSGDTLPVDAVLLTADQHNNAFASLNGLTILQGSPSFLYYHGVYDNERSYDIRRMFQEPGALSQLAPKYGITHVILSPYERDWGASEQLFSHLKVVFQNSEVIIYEL